MPDRTDSGVLPVDKFIYKWRESRMVDEDDPTLPSASASVANEDLELGDQDQNQNDRQRPTAPL